jgi:uncharacterized protein YeaO (DUF488 family)
MTIKLKRVYDPPSADDGYRILVDRLWPRGMTKERARVDLWMRDIAPSDELRTWFHHEAANWPEFERRYQQELAGSRGLLEQIRDIAPRESRVTLLYGAKDEVHNQAVVIADALGKPTS